MEQQIEAVNKMQKYISEHIEEQITPADLARASNFSPWYARRLFEQYVGISPSEYIRKLKLSISALKLRDEKCHVIDAAMDMGFKSVDGYPRAFKQEFGKNPKEYSTSPVPLYLFTPYAVKFRYIERSSKAVENLRNVFVQVIEKPVRKVIIKRGVSADNYFDYCSEVGCDIWGLLTSIKSIGGEPVCLWLNEKYIKPNTSKYVQGVEVENDYSGIIPEGFDVITLPASKYLMFQGEPFAEEDYCAAIEAIWQAESKYDPTFIGYKWDSENPKIQLEPRGERGYIELMPIKAL